MINESKLSYIYKNSGISRFAIYMTATDIKNIVYHIAFFIEYDII